MDSSPDTIQKMHKDQGREKIKKLQEKISTTKYNLEVSEEIIAQTPSDAQQEKLAQKNILRRHGIAGLEQEIRNIEQALED
ncbi:Small, acid-soluble spore protein Tlp [bioreactor metagenome]|uniref:Small, acid-soluble spore protein Tlp n=1 Tax=bioreactor metagenome TaxID=1076179 RepID=A0A645IGT1_9ZZZZ|nr:small, acid-soluble spore protein tlp [Oscillospiraceae bacterium]